MQKELQKILNQMNGLLGTIDLLFNTPLNDEQKEFAEVLQKSVMSLMAVTDIFEKQSISSKSHINISQITTCHSLMENKKQGVQILFIGAGRVNQKIIKNILNKAGYLVEAFENMTKAANAFETGLFNFVLMELNHLEPQSFEKIKTIRKLEEKNGLKNIIIIVITKHSARIDDKIIVNEYILKPVTSETLLRVIEKWSKKTESPFEKKMAQHIGDTIFDFDAALERAMGEASFLKMLVKEFIKSLPGKLDAMKEDILNKDHQSLTLHAHSLRGSALNIDAEGISFAALELEKKANAGDLKSSAEKIRLLGKEFQRFNDHIKIVNWGDV